uniref:RRM domain-containing protein n=1 Tax=Leersia perrieri TaxID=77586 RepID=A0A0D9WES2_9ORYZ
MTVPVRTGSGTGAGEEITRRRLWRKRGGGAGGCRDAGGGAGAGAGVLADAARGRCDVGERSARAWGDLIHKWSNFPRDSVARPPRPALALSDRPRSSPRPPYRRPPVRMAPARIQEEKRISKNYSKTTCRKKVSKKRSAQQGVNGRFVVPQLCKFPKFIRLFSLQTMLILRQRKSKWEQQEDEVELLSKDEGCSNTFFWRDPDTMFCVICGDKGNHLELMCPYNYLSPSAYVPCRARLALWGNYTTTPHHKCSRHKEEEQSERTPVDDEANTRRLGFLRSLVRVSNLPESCSPEQLVNLFRRFGSLRMWYVAARGSGACKGYGCIVFRQHQHAEEAVEALSCWDFGDRKLRVDWAYPSLNC